MLCLSTEETDDGRHLQALAAKPARRPPSNKGKLVGAKPPPRPSHVWPIPNQAALAPPNLAIDSKLRGCDPVAVRVDEAPNGHALDRATRAVLPQVAARAATQ